MTDLAERRGLDDDVYQPAEDSRLLAEVATERIDPADRVIDVGTGSGFVAEEIASETGASVIGTDLNPHACRQARERGVQVVRADLLDPFAGDVADVVVCNPPYLPIGAEDAASVGAEGDSGAPGEQDGSSRDGDWMTVALSGGETGREVIEDLLADVGRVLAPGGEVLLLVSSLTGVDEVAARASDAGFSAVALADESFPFETLTVLALRR